MLWNKSQSAIERVREEHAKFKASNEAVRKEAVQKDMPLRPGEVPLIVSTHDKFVDQGRANVLALLNQQERT